MCNVPGYHASRAPHVANSYSMPYVCGIRCLIHHVLQVNAIEDMTFGTRFHLEDGSVRGPWCPGGTAGPVLRAARLLRVIRNWTPFARGANVRNRDQSKELEVLPLRKEADGSLTVTLLLPSSSTCSPMQMPRRLTPSTPWANKWELRGYDH